MLSGTMSKQILPKLYRYASYNSIKINHQLTPRHVAALPLLEFKRPFTGGYVTNEPQPFELKPRQCLQATYSAAYPGVTSSVIKYYSSKGDHLPPSQDNSCVLTELEYEEICSETLDAIAERFDDLGEQSFTDDSYDVQFASGVITVKLGGDKGTFVINKQTPNKQIWLSSPYSGPKRYDFIDDTWMYKHDGNTLHCLLSEELSQAFEREIDFTDCAFGKKPK